MVFRPPSSPAVLDEIKSNGPLQKELLLILKEIKIITEKLKQEEHFLTDFSRFEMKQNGWALYNSVATSVMITEWKN